MANFNLERKLRTMLASDHEDKSITRGEKDIFIKSEKLAKLKGETYVSGSFRSSSLIPASRKTARYSFGIEANPVGFVLSSSLGPEL